MFVYAVYTVQNTAVCLGIDYTRLGQLLFFANNMVVGFLAISFGYVFLRGYIAGSDLTFPSLLHILSHLIVTQRQQYRQQF